MANNETVGNVHDDMLQVVADEFGYVAMAQSDFVDYAERFAAANKREMDGLRSLVGELAHALEETCVPDSCRNCETEYKDCTSDCPNRKRRALVSRAREAIGGEK